MKALFPLALAAATLAATPAAAQAVAGPGITPRPAAGAAALGEVPKRAPINGVLVLYGTERCPTDASGNEIIICERRSAQEQYRLPKELREFVVTPENASWATKVEGTISEGVGANGTGSCSVTGQSGQTGCATQQFDAYARARKAREAAAARVP